MRIYSLLAAVLLTGCSIGGTPVTPTAPGPVAPAAPQQAMVLNGLARYYGEALAGADVAATPVGASAPVATGKTGADGRFQLTLPDTVKRGTMLKVVASKDGRVVASFATAPAPRQVLQAEERIELLLLDENGTVVYLILSPRVEAAAQVATNEDGSIDVGVTAEALAAFKLAVEAITLQPIPRASFESATQGAALEDGQLSLTRELVAAIAAVVPAGLVPALEQQAESLAVVIRTQVQAGKPKPDADKTGKLAVGNQKEASAVFSDDGHQSEHQNPGPGPGPGVNPPPDIAASGSLAVTDGHLVNPAATASIELGD